jgi:hypothetical protein
MSVLSDLSSTIMMECACRDLAFRSYRTSQEIISYKHLAKILEVRLDLLQVRYRD